jgi:hypothetical protein
LFLLQRARLPRFPHPLLLLLLSFRLLLALLALLALRVPAPTQ